MLWRAKERCGVEYCFFISPQVPKLPQPHIFMSTGTALYEYPHQVLLLPAQDGSGPLDHSCIGLCMVTLRKHIVMQLFTAGNSFNSDSQFKFSNIQTNLYFPNIGDSLSRVFLLKYLSYCSNAECWVLFLLMLITLTIIDVLSYVPLLSVFFRVSVPHFALSQHRSR